MIFFAEILLVVALAILVFSSFMYLRDLTNKKKHRNLSSFESVMYIIIGVAILTLAVSLLALTFVG
ncbi:hypothetical protein [Virgibacillus salexigens]|uniref:DUF3976 domain-containing protein n=1 Tax=Virgibacillus kapii TaxID=1638645 RepID=A0ABQ2D3M2_9BACI|nr:hypothetical protein M948_14955 [Virgibacillus sp. CM-4]GGJ44919.1 hypothetical protein GCM10007111_03610 [Virgibacillus kapii]